MDFDHNNVRLRVNEDRLSSLPDELIHKILSCFDTKFVVQTCLLSPRWKYVWTSVPCLNFSSTKYESIPEFSNLVTNVLSRRNHQIEVSSVKLKFHVAARQEFVRKIADYAFSHNVKELNVSCCPKNHHLLPSFFFSSQSLKHFTFKPEICAHCDTPKTPWNFPALTILHLSNIDLHNNNSRESIDLFSKCVNLKNLTLESFSVPVEAFDIITPRLSNLMLIKFGYLKVLNLIAPELKNLTIIDCSIKHLNAPPGISSFCFQNYRPLQLHKDRFHSLNRVTASLKYCYSNIPYKEEDARETIKMLQDLHDARFLTLNLDIVECLSSFPDLVSCHPSPFRNLICLNIDSSREEPYKVKISNKVRNFLLENSPNAKFIVDLPEEPPTEAMIAKEAQEKKAKLIADIKSQMTEWQALIEHENALLVERKQAEEKTKLALKNLLTELQHVLTKKKTLQIDPEQAKRSVTELMAQIHVWERERRVLFKKEYDDIIAIDSKKWRVKFLLEDLPKRQRGKKMKADYSRQFEQTETLCVRLVSSYKYIYFDLKKMLVAFNKNVADNILTFQDFSKIPLPSQPSSSYSSAINR